MSADDDVDLASFEVSEDRRLFLWRLKATERLDINGKIRQPIAEGARVLVSQNCRRNEHDHLLAALDCLEGSANRDFRLAVTDVTYKQAIHRAGLLHVAFHIGRSSSLVGCVLEQKRRLQLTLPHCIRDVRRTRRNFSPRVKVEQLDGHLLNSRARLVALCCPALAAK